MFFTFRVVSDILRDPPDQHTDTDQLDRPEGISMTIAIGIQLEREILMVSDSRVTTEPEGLFEDRGSKIEALGQCRAIWTDDEAFGPWAHLFATQEKYETETMDVLAWNQFMADFTLYLRDDRGCTVTRDEDMMPRLQAMGLIASPTQGLLCVEPTGFVQKAPVRKLRFIGCAQVIAQGVAAALDFEDDTDLGYIVRNLLKTVELTCEHSIYCGMPCHIERIALWGTDEVEPAGTPAGAWPCRAEA